MREPERRRAVEAARAVGNGLGLRGDVAIVLHDSNKLSVRLLPGDVLARVAPAAHGVAGFEIALAQRLAEAGCPVARVAAPGVHARDGFDVTLWTFYETASPEVPADAYADALARLHAGMRGVEAPAPHFTERVGAALAIVADRGTSPGLAEDDRELLVGVLRDLGASVAGRGTDQLLHGEPHQGNLLAAKEGPLFVDFETACVGPVEFDLAHAPDEVADHYPAADPELVRDCRLLMLAMIVAWRWEPGDDLPDGERLSAEWLAALRAGANGRQGGGTP
ncbi:Phosphotransferase enzyme family protein [Glycomyces sambucus]|uniref:Phosphotransferase enzyme family protein n=1 Tax=Glycomyces sambucus TaxID=380244 RepID=A0A1G9DF54_9ACTN|nr:aminoglycoside phosphotransferase family protein [Glycomyces sambucus]SDK62508.1 Phosphotransferase enzyme family protein [Glycomyces sambucus]